MAVPGWSAGLQESKELVLDEHVRRRGSSTEGYCVVWLSHYSCKRGEESEVWEVLDLTRGVLVSRRRYKLFRGLGRYRGIERYGRYRAQSQPSTKVFCRGWWAVSESTRWHRVEWKSSAWGEGCVWDLRPGAFVDSKGHWLESPDCHPEWHFSWEHSLGWVSEDREGREHSTCCLCQVPLPVPVSVTEVQRGQRFPVSSCPAARQLCWGEWFLIVCVLLSPLAETQSLWVLAGFLFGTCSLFLQVFLIFLVFFVQPVMCPNQVSAHWQSTWFFPVWFLIQNSSTSYFSLLTFPLPWQWEHQAWLICPYLPHLSELTILGLPAGSWMGPAVCRTEPWVSDKRQSLWDEITHSAVRRGLFPKKTQGTEH